MSQEIRDIIHGYLMSDGYLRKQGQLIIDQGFKQKRFVQWLYDQLQPIRTSTPIRVCHRVHPVTKVLSRSYRFQTRAVLKGFYSMWYTIDENGNQRKKLPKTIGCFFNATFISLWYAGDGTKVLGSRGAKFEVTSFTVSERLLLKSLFMDKFDIQTQIISSGVSKNGTSQWALKVPAKEYTKFRRLITQNHLIPSLFPHKLHKSQ